MNLFEVVSEKFRDTNAMDMISNYPTHFIKLLVKALDKVGKVRNKIEDPAVEDPFHRGYIFTKNNRGQMTTDFPKEKIFIEITQNNSQTYTLYLELKQPGTLEISPTEEKLNLTRMTVGEVIDHIVNNVRENKNRTIEPKELKLKNLKKILDARGLKVDGKHYSGMSGEYDHVIEISNKSGDPLTVPDKLDIYMLIPKIFKWYELQGVVVLNQGIAGGSDYYFIHSAIGTSTETKTETEYTRLAKGKARLIKNSFGDKEA